MMASSGEPCWQEKIHSAVMVINNNNIMFARTTGMNFQFISVVYKLYCYECREEVKGSLSACLVFKSKTERLYCVTRYK